MHSAEAESFVKADFIRVSFERRPKIRFEKKQAGGGWKRFVSKSSLCYEHFMKTYFSTIYRKVLSVMIS